MRILNYTIKIIIALFLAKFVSGLVISKGGYIMFIAIVIGFLFLFSKWKYKFILFSLAAFYPLYFPGRFIVISSPEWIMIIAPLICLILIVELAIKKQPLFSRKAAIFFAAVGVICLWALVNYIKNPVLGEQFTGASVEEGGIRAYFILFVGATTFLCSYWFFRYKKIDVNKWLVLLLGVSFFLGVLRIISYFYNFYIPFLGGTFEYLFFEDIKEADAFRIGGLSEVATMGLSILLSLYHKKNWNKSAIFLIAAFIFMIVLAGGRGTFVGVIIALILYISVVNRKYFVPSILSVLIIAGMYVMFFSNVKLYESRMGRVVAFTDEAIERQKTRITDARIFFEYFLENPVFGKGIGYDVSKLKGIKLGKGFQETAIGSISQGGHGAYVSIIGIFGIGGGFFIIVMLFGTMYYAYKIFKGNTAYHDDDRLAILAFVRLVIMSFSFIPGGDGYSDMKLWFLAGMIAAIISKDEVVNAKLQ
jgi:hypothetical protein